MSNPASCPNCGNAGAPLVPIEAGLKLRLQESMGGLPVPAAVCASCLTDLTKNSGQGAKLRAEAVAKEQSRVVMWKSRVGLVKQAKSLMAIKNYSDAAVAYEKYVRILEIIYDKKPGELNPELFKNETRHQELTVIAGVYWDLMRIYDTHSRYQDRQLKAAEKLADFARFTPMFQNLIKQAETQSRNAKNPLAFKKFLSRSSQNRPRCFIATSAFEYELTPTIETLCTFRDHYLRKRRWGRAFILVYYKISPRIAEWLDHNPLLKPVVRRVLTRLAVCVNKNLPLNPYRSL